MHLLSRSLLALAVLLPGTLLAQWPTDSLRVLATNALPKEESHDQPQVLADGRGGLWIAYTATRGPLAKPNVMLQHWDAQGQPLLPADGLQVCPQEYMQAQPRLLADTEGGIFLLWEEHREYLRGIYGMRLNARGELLWEPEGEYLSPAGNYDIQLQAMADGQGGCFLAWADRREGNNEKRVFVQRISPYGFPMWQFDGVPACAVAPGIQQKPQLDLTPEGGMVVLWEDFRSGTGWQIFAQKFTGTGEREWVTPGIAVTPPFTGMTLRHPRMRGDGFGGFLCTYEALGTGTHDKDIYLCRISRHGKLVYNHPVTEAFGDQFAPQLVLKGADVYVWWEDHAQPQDKDVYCQQLDIQTGKARWPADGALMCLNKGNQTAPLASTHGVYDEPVFVWLDDRDGQQDIYCQKMNNLGEAHWDYAGVPVARSKYLKRNLVATPDGQGGTWVCWVDARNPVAPHIYAAHVTLLGTANADFPADGKPIGVPHSQPLHTLEGPVLVAGTAQDFYVVWEDYRNGWRNSDLYAQRIDSLGQLKWMAGGQPLCHAPGYQSLPRVLPASDGIWTAWTDRRNGVDDDLYWQRLSQEGHAQMGQHGQAIVAAFRSQNALQVTKGPDGSLWTCWTDARAFLENGFDLYAQCWTPKGEPRWAPEGQAVAMHASYQTSPALAVLPGGHALIAFMDDHSGHYNIALQRMDILGNMFMGPMGKRVAPHPAHQRYPQLVPLAQGQHLLLWTDDRQGQDATHIRMMGIGPSGNAVWGQSGGVQACTCYGRQSHPQALALPDGGFLLGWLDQRAERQVGHQLVLQRYDAGGQPLWDGEGVVLAGYMDELYPYSLALLPGNRVLVLWQAQAQGTPAQVRYSVVNVATGSPTVPKSIGPPTPAAQLMPRMAVQGRTAAVCWVEELPNKVQRLLLRMLYF